MRIELLLTTLTFKCEVFSSMIKKKIQTTHMEVDYNATAITS